MTITSDTERFLATRRSLLKVILTELALPVINSALEMAAGDGSLSMVLKEMFPRSRVFALDRNTAFLDEYRRHLGLSVELIRGDITDPISVLDRYDLIAYSNVFRHLDQTTARDTLSLAASRLRRGGHCLILERVNAPQSAAQRLMVRVHEIESELCRWRDERAEHLYTAGELKRLARSANLHPTRVRLFEATATTVSLESWEKWCDDLFRQVKDTPVSEQRRLLCDIAEANHRIQKFGLSTLPIFALLCH